MLLIATAQSLRFATRRAMTMRASASKRSTSLQAATIAAPSTTKERLDSLLLSRGLAPSRSQATALVKAGAVLLAGDVAATKPGQKLHPDCEIRVAEGSLTRYVSRGGEKLHAALERWPSIARSLAGGGTAADFGASTGGYTDCALKHGAAAVDCLDVGTGQLHASLLGDDRVRNFEGINCRDAGALAKLPLRDAYDLVVIDVSFISLELILPNAWARAKADLVCLVKPQFEVGPAIVRQGKGVVRDAAAREAALDGVRAFCEAQLDDCEPLAAFECPFYEEKGNREYLLHLRRRGA